MSAAIVFISFTLKEELSEYLKDRLALLNSVDAQIAKNSELSLGANREFVVRQQLTQVIALLRRMNNLPDDAWQEIIMEQPLLVQELIDEQMGDVIAVERISPRQEYYKANVRRIFDERRKPLSTLDVIRHAGELTPEARNEIRESEKQLSDVERGAQELQDEAFKELLARKKKLETATARTKWGVYILFIFGWTLGLGLSAIGEQTEPE